MLQGFQNFGSQFKVVSIRDSTSMPNRQIGSLSTNNCIKFSFMGVASTETIFVCAKNYGAHNTCAMCKVLDFYTLQF